MKSVTNLLDEYKLLTPLRVVEDNWPLGTPPMTSTTRTESILAL